MTLCLYVCINVIVRVAPPTYDILKVITTPTGRQDEVVGSTHSTISTAKHQGSKRQLDIDVDDSTGTLDDGDKRPPKKKGRPSGVTSGHTCTLCILWIESGSCDNLETYHHNYGGIMRHPQELYALFSIYASNNSNFSFIIEPDSCVCNGCYRDFRRYCECSLPDRTNYIPQWLKLKQKQYPVPVPAKHCFMCCQNL